MLKKAGKYIFWIVLIAVVGYNSVYIKKLNEVKAAETKAFNAKDYARDYLYKKLPALYNKAPDMEQLIAALKANPSSAFTTYSHSLNKGETGYFLVAGEGEVTRIDDSNTFIKLKGGSSVKLATEYIFGNTVRDAAGLISMDEFTNSMDINNVSEEINKLIKTEVLPPFKEKVKKGDLVQFKGCIEMNQSSLKLEDIEIVPVALTIKN